MKRLLTEERVPGASAVARFVGVEAYETAGGQVLRDLFARDDEIGVWFEDPVLLEKLATEKLQAAADELATRWKWPTAMIEVAWGDTARYGRIEPQPAERTPEEQAEIGKLEARQAELAELDDDEWTQETVTEAEAIETCLDEIEGAVEARAMWRREDFSIAGCIVTVAHDGALQVIPGLVKPEDMPKDEAGKHRTRLARKDTPVAIKATARELACLIYLMVTEGQEYVEQGIDAYEKRRLNRKFVHLDRQAQKLGIQLIPKTQGEEKQNPILSIS